MDTKAVWRSGGLTVGLVLGAMAGLAADRPTAEVRAEYVKFASGSDSISAYIAYPERADPAPGVLVIHEIFGMSDFVRDATQRPAKLSWCAMGRC